LSRSRQEYNGIFIRLFKFFWRFGKKEERTNNILFYDEYLLQGIPALSQKE
jgi:uncharacterized membrane protein